jgi:hypothetical protein
MVKPHDRFLLVMIKKTRRGLEIVDVTSFLNQNTPLKNKGGNKLELPPPNDLPEYHMHLLCKVFVDWSR